MQLQSRKPHAGMRLPPLEADQMQQDADLDDMDNATGPPVYDGQPDPNQQPMPDQYPEEIHDAPTDEGGQAPPDDDDDQQVPQQEEMEQPDLGEAQ